MKRKKLTVYWYTNLTLNKDREFLTLTKKYSSKDYPLYDNYDAIEVSRIVDIPKDYEGVMGVPISFLVKYNPDQFEILGLTTGRCDFGKESWPTKKYANARQINKDGSIVNGSKSNTRAMILFDDIPAGVYYTADNANGFLKSIYARILIKNKKVVKK